MKPLKALSCAQMTSQTGNKGTDDGTEGIIMHINIIQRL